MRYLTMMTLCFVGCATATEIRVGEAKPDYDGPVYAREDECNVHDYPAATDVPAGAEHIGWIKVPRQESEEETLLALRKAICEKGGDALSQMSWIVPAGRQQGVALQANAWVSP